MSLRPDRQTVQVNIDYPCPWTQERGGALTFAFISGVPSVQYSHDPSGYHYAGIQLNDVEFVDFTRQPFQQYLRDMDVAYTIVGAGQKGDFVTDWLCLIGPINNGDAVYVGPSGTFTNSAAFGGEKVGRIIGPLDVDPHIVVMRGFGPSFTYTDPCTKRVVTENNWDDRTLVISPGYLKIHVDIGENLK